MVEAAARAGWVGKLTGVTGEITAGGAVDPSRRAARIVLFFPDGQAGFGFVNDVTTRVEGSAAMLSGDANPNGEFAEVEMADAMDAVRGEDREFLVRFGDDARALFVGEEGVGLVFEGEDGLALVTIADPALEGDAGAGAFIGEGAGEGGGVEGRRGDAETHGG